jgi:hypothetical protein
MLMSTRHANSVDKFDNGDYLLSSRALDTIYRINATDKSIAWRLGGKYSDFVMDFNFSSQHHAKVYTENETATVISFFDNASNDVGSEGTANTSSAKLVAIYPKDRKAKAGGSRFGLRTRLTFYRLFKSGIDLMATSATKEAMPMFFLMETCG